MGRPKKSASIMKNTEIKNTPEIVQTFQLKKTKQNQFQNLVFKMSIPQKDDFAFISYKQARQKYPQEVISYLTAKISKIAPKTQQKQNDEDHKTSETKIGLLLDCDLDQSDSSAQKCIPVYFRLQEKAFLRSPTSSFKLCKPKQQKQNHKRVSIRKLRKK